MPEVIDPSSVEASSVAVPASPSTVLFQDAAAFEERREAIEAATDVGPSTCGMIDIDVGPYTCDAVDITANGASIEPLLRRVLRQAQDLRYPTMQVMIHEAKLGNPQFEAAMRKLMRQIEPRASLNFNKEGFLVKLPLVRA